MSGLEDLRKRKKFSQSKVAYKIGMNERVYADVEKGKWSLKLNDAAKLASLFDVNLEDIYIATQK